MVGLLIIVPAGIAPLGLLALRTSGRNGLGIAKFRNCTALVQAALGFAAVGQVPGAAKLLLANDKFSCEI